MSNAAPPPPEPAILLRQALRLHLDDQLEAAEALYRQILDQDPNHAQALGMLGMALSDGPDTAEAEAILVRHLALRPADGASLHRLGRLRARQGDDLEAVALFRSAVMNLPALPPIHNDLGVALHQLGRSEEGLSALDQAVRLDPGYGVAHGNRGVLLFELGRFAEAVEAHLTALAYISPAAGAVRASTLHNLARAARKTEDHAMATRACEVLLATNPDDPETAEALALLLEHIDRPAAALATRNATARRAGLRRDGRMDAAAPRLLLLGAVGAGHLPTRYLVDTETFTTLSISLLSPDQPDAPLGAVSLETLSQAGLVFNTLGEVDKQGGQFEVVEAICAALGKPVLNPPAAIRRTGRDQAAALFGDIPDLVVPQVQWTTRAGLAAPPWPAPYLVRPPGDHGGENLVKVADEADLAGYQARPGEPDDRLLLTRFHDFRSADGHWRKYRLIFVDRQVYPYHLAICDDWLAHYWRAQTGTFAWKKAEEEAFLADWRAVFGARGARALDMIAQRLDLDYGGIDCALLDDGRVLLFEANACILLHLDEPAAGFPYKHRYVPPIREAFSAMVRKRAGR